MISCARSHLLPVYTLPVPFHDHKSSIAQDQPAYRVAMFLVVLREIDNNHSNPFVLWILRLPDNRDNTWAVPDH